MTLKVGLVGARGVGALKCFRAMEATDASYFKVIGWGYYYMVTVMDDYSRFILAHKLQRDMTSDSFSEVV